MTITAHNSSYREVMFSQESVFLSTRYRSKEYGLGGRVEVGGRV